MAQKNIGGARKIRGVPNGQSIRRHRKFGGHADKSPKLRHQMKRDAEANSRRSRSAIIDPKKSVSELFENRSKPS